MEPTRSTFVEQPPTAGAVAVGVFWRAWLLVIAGGFVVGSVWNLGLMLEDDDFSSTTSFGVGSLGLLTGVFVGPVMAFAVALVVSLFAVPFPGATATRRLARWSATATVGVMVGVVTASTIGGVSVVLAIACAMGLAWWSAPWAVGWYIRRVAVWYASIAEEPPT